ncbi:MAG: hypothetical protein ACW96M_01260 [Candidatus Thorarchaeota archaeon]
MRLLERVEDGLGHAQIPPSGSQFPLVTLGPAQARRLSPSRRPHAPLPESDLKPSVD